MVTARIDLAGLTTELSGFKNNFDSWSQQTVASADVEKDKHFKELRQLQATIRSLYQQQKDLENKALEVQQRLADESSQIAELQEELKRVQTEQEALPSLLADVRLSLEAELAAAESRAQDMAKKEITANKTLKGVQTGLNMYREYLGLDFEHNDGEQMNIVFTHLDSGAPERRFSVAIRVQGDKYEATSSTPPLDSLPELVDELNASNDFSAFVRKTRAQFADSLPT